MTTENLFGYTLVDSAYTQGAAGAIRGERDDVPSSFTVATNRVTGLNSDPTVHYFTASDGTPSAVVAQYDFSSPGALTMNIYDISGATWVVQASVIWSGIYNLYGITVIGNFMYAIDYDHAKVVRIAMTNYQQIPFPGNVYQFDNTPEDYEKHGMALATDGTYLYALFNTVDNPNASNPDYKAGTVVKLNVSGTTISEDSRVDVGKNAFTLEYYDNKLYVASIGGKQLENNYNPGSKLDVVSLGASMSVTTAFTASSTIPGDFRDITLSDSGDAYILTGYYTTGYATLTGKLYKTTASNINAGTPSIGSVVQNINTAGFLWATLYDDVSPSTYDRLWFVRGNQVDIFNPPPASTSATATSYVPSTLGSSPVNANLNGVSLFGSGTTTLTRKMRSFSPHAHLASQAMMAAAELLEDDKE